jgi:hypothetical protein
MAASIQTISSQTSSNQTISSKATSNQAKLVEENPVEAISNHAMLS